MRRVDRCYFSSETHGDRYQRVATSEEEEKGNKRRRAEFAEQISTKVQAFAWVVVGSCVVYQTDLFRVLRRERLDVATATFSLNCVLCFYLTIWLPYVQKVHVEWNVYCPRVIPAMTLSGVVCTASLVRGLWHVYGLLTPLILVMSSSHVELPLVIERAQGITFVSSIMSLHFVPWPC